MEEDQFDDDPALRAAIRRACGDEAAPQALRARVEAMMGAPAGAATASGWAAPKRLCIWPSRWMGDSPYKTLAAAVIALIAVGVMFYQGFEYFHVPRGTSASIPHVEFPLTVVSDMVKAHDNCAKLSDHHLVPGADAAAAALHLQQTEGFTVATLNNAAGWQFKGAGECAVGAGKAAHLLYARDADTVSVFSMKGPAHCSGGNSDLYRGMLEGHPVSGFVYSGVVYAVVASSPAAHLALTDLDPLMSKVQDCVGATGCAVPPSAVPTTKTAP